MSDNLQLTILQKLINDESFAQKVYPHLKGDYFQNADKAVFELIRAFVEKYGRQPTVSSLKIDAESSDVVRDSSQLRDVLARVNELSINPDVKSEWLVQKTEKWCRDRAVYMSIMESIDILDGRRKDVTENIIPEILQKALSVSFDTNIGHDYIGDFEHRYEFYHDAQEHIPFDLDLFNKITNGGVVRKTLNVIMGGTGCGKSLFMCHTAASHLLLGKNVLYITLEMSEERIAERIDANLMNIDIHQLTDMSQDMYTAKIKKIAAKTVGRLMIKEYPTASAHVGHFRALLSELRMKKSFVPDIIYIDYLNICASSRLRGLGGAVNSYGLVKAIAEEVRGMAVEFDVPIITATQVNREGFGSSDVELTNTAESWGLPSTADLFVTLIVTEELDELGQVMVKQLKNRYNDLTSYRRFLIGIDRAKMKLFDLEASAQTLIQTKTTSGGASSKTASFDDFKV